MTQKVELYWKKAVFGTPYNYFLLKYISRNNEIVEYRTAIKRPNINYWYWFNTSANLANVMAHLNETGYLHRTMDNYFHSTLHEVRIRHNEKCKFINENGGISSIVDTVNFINEYLTYDVPVLGQTVIYDADQDVELPRYL